MATETSSMPVNGNYAPHQGYGGLEQQQNNIPYAAPPTNNISSAAPAEASKQTPPAGSATQAQQPDISKDEVGWYFVEQYYTTLSRNPEKLYLFYNKRSQFVSGQETAKVAVCVGQRAINDRIKELDFQDCKVRVTNVDSQASDSNIVIQVIGEISNKSQAHKRFTQTFVLATQTNGYFVLNDIFRYLNDEEDEPEADVEAGVEEAAEVTEAVGEPPESDAITAVHEPKTLTSSVDPVAVEQDAQQVDKELEQKVLKEQPQAPEEPAVNGSPEQEAEEEPVEEEPTPAVIATEEVPAATAASTVGDENLKPEAPKDPEPTPSESPAPAKAATPPPPAAPKPTAPKTWASLAASANKVATPAPPAPSPTSTSQGKSASSTAKPVPAARATTPTAPAASSSSVPQVASSAPAAQRDVSPAAGSQGEEWTPVGGSHTRQQSRQVPTPYEAPSNRGYIKNVHSGINTEELNAALNEVAEVIYFDVAPEKVSYSSHTISIHSLTISQNCAFVDFKSPEAFQAAVAASPFTVGGERLSVVQRYTKQTGFGPRGAFQGGRGRGNMGQGPPRGAFQSRGGFVPRGNRGASTPTRGRGAGSSQAT